MTRDESLEKAKNDYPKGCYYKSVTSGDVFQVTRDHRIMTNGHIDAGAGYLYHSGKWAQRVNSNGTPYYKDNYPIF